MTRSDLIDALASRFPHLVTKDAEVSVKLILGAMRQSLSKGGRVEIRGFGSFGVIYRPSRIGRNPKNGALARHAGGFPSPYIGLT